MRTRLAHLAGTAVLVTGVLCAGAGLVSGTPVTLYDNYTAGDGHFSTGWEIGLGISVAMPFTPGIDAYLDSVTLSLAFGDGPNILDVAIHEDATGLPGAVLEALHLVEGIPSGPYPPIVLDSVLTPLLVSGHQYWLSAHADPRRVSCGPGRPA